jgi:hypothetical protein
MGSLMTRRRPVLAALVLGPLLGVVIFAGLIDRAETPPATASTGQVHVPWHKSTRLTALELNWIGADIVDVMTRRDAKSGTTYVLRRIWCATREVQYLGEGATEKQAKEGLGVNSPRGRLQERSISLYVAAYACPNFSL